MGREHGFSAPTLLRIDNDGLHDLPSKITRFHDSLLAINLAILPTDAQTSRRVAARMSNPSRRSREATETVGLRDDKRQSGRGALLDTGRSSSARSEEPLWYNFADSSEAQIPMKVKSLVLLIAAFLCSLVPVTAQSLAALSASDRASVEAACSYSKYVEGPAAYHRCLSGQLAKLGSSQAPSLAGLSQDDQSSIEAACSYPKYVEGAASYHACLTKQLLHLGSSPAPSLAGLSRDDQSSIEAACSYSKYVEGAASYHACLNKQLRELARAGVPLSVQSRPKATAVVVLPEPASATPVSVSTVTPATNSTITPPAATGLCAENGSCFGDISDKTGLPKTVAVQGYYRKDGTYVRGYSRSHK
jgi:hypothetical protein